MAEQVDELVLEVKIDTEKVAENLAAATKALAEHKQQQKELKKAMEESNGTNAVAAKIYAEVSAQIEKESRAVKSNTALLQAETLSRLDDNASLDEQRQALNAAQKAYAQLSGAEKTAADAAGGLRDQIARLSDKVKEQEAAIGDARRNVGNYAMQAAEATGKMGFFGRGLAGVVNPLNNLTVGLKAASATPFLAVFSLIITVLTKLADRFKSNAAAMEQLTPLFGAFAGVGNLVNKVIDKIAEGLGWIAEKAVSLAKRLGVLKDTISDSVKISREELEIQKEQQRVALANAESTNRISKLQAEAAEKDKKTASQRLALLQQAADEEEAIAKRSYDLAKREYELQVLKNAQSASSQEDLKKENDLKIAMINAETALFDKRKSLNAQMAAMREQLKKGNEQMVASDEESVKKLAALRDEMEKRTRTANENAIKELEKKRDEELAIEGTTAEEKLKIEQYYADEIKKIRDKEETGKIEAKRKAREQFGLEPDKTPEEQELALLQSAREQDLLNDEEYEIAKTLITQKYSKQRESAIKDEVTRATQLYEQEVKTAVSSAGAAFSALGDLMGAFSDESEDAAAAQKAFALGSILINQAMAIAEGAKGISAAMAGAAEAAAATGPAAPIMLPVFTAQMVGHVLAIVASVASTIVQAKQLFAQAEEQKFATGGIVGGTSYTGDKVSARLNSREMILNTQQQTRLFDALNGGSENLGVNYELMAAAMASVPAPVVVYKELQDFGDRVSTYKEIASV